MQHDPKDIQQFIDTTITLDIAVSALFGILNRHGDPMAREIAQVMQTTAVGLRDKLPPDQASNIEGKVSAWIRALTKPPTH